MKILILGAGRVGSTLAKHLVDLDHSVTVVDRDEVRLNELSDHLDVQPIGGGASYPDVLERAGAHQADVLIATTDNDEVNMIACEMAHSLFDIETKIARVRNRSYLNKKYRSTIFQPKNLSVDFIMTPEIEIARAICSNLRVNGATNVLDFPGGLTFLSVVCSATAPLVHTPLRLVQGLYPSLSLAFVALKQEARTFLPSSDTTIRPGDTVHFVLPSSQVPEAMAAFGYSDPGTPSVTLAGFGMIGGTLAQELTEMQSHLPLRILESDPLRAKEASQRFPHALVLQGDALNPVLLQEAEIGACDTFVAVTNDDSTNVLSALLAKRQGASRVLTLLSAMRNASFVASLGVDTVINPNAITVSSVLRILRQHRMRSLCVLEEGVEVLEITVDESSPLVGFSLEDLTIAGQVSLIALRQGEALALAPTEGRINAQDVLIVAVTKEAIAKMEKLVSGSGRFF